MDSSLMGITNTEQEDRLCFKELILQVNTELTGGINHTDLGVVDDSVELCKNVLHCL